VGKIVDDPPPGSAGSAFAMPGEPNSTDATTPIARIFVGKPIAEMTRPLLMGRLHRSQFQ
jgi:hypothetical protein